MLCGSGVMVSKKRKKTPNVRLSNFLEDSNSGLLIFLLPITYSNISF